jgi:hypothetical protein
MKEKTENKDTSPLSRMIKSIFDAGFLLAWEDGWHAAEEEWHSDKSVEDYREECFDNAMQQYFIPPENDGRCRFNCRINSRLKKIIDRIEKHSEKTVHAPKHRLVLYSDLQDLIRERKGEKDKR